MPTPLYGEQKIFGWFGGQPVPIGSLFSVAGVIEIVLGLLITIGLFTSYGHSLPAVKWPSPISSASFRKVFGLWKVQASRRYYSVFIFLYMATQGSGNWSVDAARAG